MRELTVGQATGLVALVLRRLGTPDDVAAAVAGWLVRADLSGHPSHGITRVHDYANRIARGSLDPRGRPTVVDRGARVGPAVVAVDGARGYGHLAAELLTRQLCQRAIRCGVAVGGIGNVSHTGRLGEWAELAAERGVILFLCYANLARPSVAPYGARQPRLATNPLTFAVPAADGDSLVLDVATSALAGGKVHLYRRNGTPLPDGVLVDRDGNPSTDAAALADGGMLLPFGGHKGYGLSLVVSLLAGCVAGQVGDGTHGVFALAVDPGCLADRSVVLGAIGEQLRRMRATPPAPGFASVQVPGDYERRHRAEAGQVVRLSPAQWSRLVELAATLGLTQAHLLAEGQP